MPKHGPEEITLEVELERLIDWRRTEARSIPGGDMKRVDETLFIFSVGLLCGLKEAKRREAL